MGAGLCCCAVQLFVQRGPLIKAVSYWVTPFISCVKQTCWCWRAVTGTHWELHKRGFEQNNDRQHRHICISICSLHKLSKAHFWKHHSHDGVIQMAQSHHNQRPFQSLTLLSSKCLVSEGHVYSTPDDRTDSVHREWNSTEQPTWFGLECWRKSAQ